MTNRACDSCNPSRINGVFCHERGCPNDGKSWDKERQQWVKYVPCRECGYEVEVGEYCDCQELGDN